MSFVIHHNGGGGLCGLHNVAAWAFLIHSTAPPVRLWARREGHYCFQYVYKYLRRNTPYGIVSIPIHTTYINNVLFIVAIVKTNVFPGENSSISASVLPPPDWKNQNKQTACALFLSCSLLLLLVFFPSPLSFFLPHPYFLRIKEAFRRRANMRSGPFLKLCLVLGVVRV